VGPARAASRLREHDELCARKVFGRLFPLEEEKDDTSMICPNQSVYYVKTSPSHHVHQDLITIWLEQQS
jgi:hypothetical protein